MVDGTAPKSRLRQRFRERAARVISVGTRGYEPKTARRLRSLNVGVFTISVSCLLFAITYAAEDFWLYKDAVILNLVLMLVCLITPVFHRFHDMAGALFISFMLMAGLFALTAIVGRDSGIQVNLVAASAALFLIFEFRRLPVIAFLIGVAIALHIAAWVMFPQGVLGSAPRTGFLTQLYINVVVTISIIIAVLVYYAFWTAERAEAETENLLHLILPSKIAERLKEKPGEPISDSFTDASVLFSDLVGFVSIARSLGAERTVEMLNHLVRNLDKLAAEKGVAKIKTIGDAYMAVSGVPNPAPGDAKRLARMALRMQSVADETGTAFGLALRLRIGIASGPVMAGVIGTERFSYDIWGDSVNLAARLENSGEPGRVHVSSSFRLSVGDGFAFTRRGTIDIKGVGQQETWFLVAELGTSEPLADTSNSATPARTAERSARA
jgi:adenylate cyclase